MARNGASRVAFVAGAAAVAFVIAALIGPRPSAPVRPEPTSRPDAILAPSAGGSLDATIAALTVRLGEVPGDWQAAASLGIAYVQEARITGDPTLYPAAAAALAGSLDLRPRDNPDALVGLATLAAARHRFVAALRWGRRALTVSSGDADAHGIVGDALVELGRYGEAVRAFQRMVDLRPDLASFARVSYALELRGDVPAAIRAMRMAFGLAGNRADAAWAAAHVGMLWFGEGRIDAAERWLLRAQAADSASREAAAGLAVVAWARGDLDRAIAASEDLVARYPAPEQVAVLGDLLEAAGDRTGAAAQYGLVEAQAKLLRANGVAPGPELILFQADHGSARAALRAARAEWSRRQSVHVADALAWALHASGRDVEATHYADLALRLGTRSALFLFHAGMIRLRLGDRDRALELLQGTHDLNPWFSVRWSPVLRETLAKLEAG